MSGKLRQNQKGMASILVTLIMMLVIILIIIGFTQISRRNQREALDNQLSATAYYAAETGVNDAITKIKANPALLTSGTSGCSGPSSFITAASLTGSQTLSPDGSVGYTCLTINSTPSSLNTDVALNQSIVMPVNPSGNTNGLKISWNASKPITTSVDWRGTTHSNVENCTTLQIFAANTSTGWTCPYGVLKVDLLEYTPGSAGLNASSDVDAQNMEAASRTLYLVPMSDPRGATYGTFPTAIPMGSIPAAHNGASEFRGWLIPASCNATSCSVVFNRSGDSGTNFGSNGTAYYVRLSATYSDAKSVTIQGVSGNISFSNAQVQIDATGKAQDELRRIQVRVPLGGTSVSSVPAYSLTSTDTLCKLIQSYSDGSNPTGTTGPGC